MKNWILFLCAFTCILSEYASAQTLTFGPKAGVNFANLQGIDDKEVDGRIGYHIGAILEIGISDKFSVQPELIYSQQGAQTQDDEDGFDIESKIILDYILLPIMAKYYLTENLSIEGGPQFGINIKSASELSVSGDNGPIDFGGAENTDLGNITTNVDRGFALGAGYKMEGGLLFQLRYSIGVIGVFDTFGDDIFENKVRNSNLQLSVGYMF